ncbi:MAG: DUF2007 domain-containing protein [Candidatus Acidiferrales bacterium]
MTQERSNETVVIAYTAESATEAMVIRSLLQSAGILTPGLVSTDPFPIPENPEDPHTEILVPQSQVDQARKIIAEYQVGNTSVSDLESSDESSGS